jgi:hypothetical protein
VESPAVRALAVFRKMVGTPPSRISSLSAFISIILEIVPWISPISGPRVPSAAWIRARMESIPRVGTTNQPAAATAGGYPGGRGRLASGVPSRAMLWRRPFRESTTRMVSPWTARELGEENSPGPAPMRPTVRRSLPSGWMMCREWDPASSTRRVPSRVSPRSAAEARSPDSVETTVSTAPSSTRWNAASRSGAPSGASSGPAHPVNSRAITSFRERVAILYTGHLLEKAATRLRRPPPGSPHPGGPRKGALSQHRGSGRRRLRQYRPARNRTVQAPRHGASRVLFPPPREANAAGGDPRRTSVALCAPGPPHQRMIHMCNEVLRVRNGAVQGHPVAGGGREGSTRSPGLTPP